MLVGIIFDMDNTVLCSKIDFDRMKKDTAQTLRRWNALPVGWQRMSTGEMIDGGVALGIDQEQYRLLWDHVAELEAVGLHNALPEPGAVECLHRLKEDFLLTLLTNNLHHAALDALQTCGMADCFSYLIGRGEVTALKPDPAGYEFLLAQFPHIPKKQWIAIGDSWLDGAAAVACGIDFASYDCRQVDWQSRGVQPVFGISRWDAQAVAALQAWKQRKLL